ncbi:MAG: hypothetical protein IT302_05720 [Dehalococcoidia bacterium]|nr:hypothetical protein [Dehalococcoidia bacterium]
MADLQPAPDFERALREAENFCWAANVAILAPEHLLAGALKVLAAAGATGLPSLEMLEAALLETHGASDDQLGQQVMFGSAARAAINQTAAEARQAGVTVLTAGVLARGVIASGELMPTFYAALGTTRPALLSALAE